MNRPESDLRSSNSCASRRWRFASTSPCGQGCAKGWVCVFSCCNLAQTQHRTADPISLPTLTLCASPKVPLLPPWDIFWCLPPQDGGVLGFPFPLSPLVFVLLLCRHPQLHPQLLVNPVLHTELMRHSCLNNLVPLKLQISAPQQLCVVTEINILTGLAIPCPPCTSG